MRKDERGIKPPRPPCLRVEFTHRSHLCLCGEVAVGMKFENAPNSGNETKTKKILIVEDEADIVDYLTMYCEAEGYSVITINDGIKALHIFKAEQPDLVLLDLMLPGLDGMEICRRIRSVSQVPIIIITARREEIDKLLGLETGADDYLTKPFSPRELMARIRVIFRRMENFKVEKETRPETAGIKGNFKVGLLEIDTETREISYEKQLINSLTNKEFDLLLALARYPGRVYSKAELEEILYGTDALFESRAISVHISNLRNKLPNPKIIETIYGIGYRLIREKN
jgi:two-component system, OmpR family, alkaline phosphatase synthesis response regulator PhoP